jgi:hypothetical protein
MKIWGIVLCVGFGLMAIIFVLQNYLLFRFFRVLDKNFHDEWIKLGKPSLIMGNSINNKLSVFLFLWNKRYLSLGNSEFSRQCSFLRVFIIFSIIAAVIWVGGCYIFITSHQIPHT